MAVSASGARQAKVADSNNIHFAHQGRSLSDECDILHTRVDALRAKIHSFKPSERTKIIEELDDIDCEHINLEKRVKSLKFSIQKSDLTRKINAMDLVITDLYRKTHPPQPEETEKPWISNRELQHWFLVGVFSAMIDEGKKLWFRV